MKFLEITSDEAYRGSLLGSEWNGRVERYYRPGTHKNSQLVA